MALTPEEQARQARERAFEERGPITEGPKLTQRKYKQEEGPKTRMDSEVKSLQGLLKNDPLSSLVDTSKEAGMMGKETNKAIQLKIEQFRQDKPELAGPLDRAQVKRIVEAMRNSNDQATKDLGNALKPVQQFFAPFEAKGPEAKADKTAKAPVDAAPKVAASPSIEDISRTIKPSKVEGFVSPGGSAAVVEAAKPQVFSIGNAKPEDQRRADAYTFQDPALAAKAKPPVVDASAGTNAAKPRTYTDTEARAITDAGVGRVQEAMRAPKATEEGRQAAPGENPFANKTFIGDSNMPVQRPGAGGVRSDMPVIDSTPKSYTPGAGGIIFADYALTASTTAPVASFVRKDPSGPGGP